MMCGTKRTMVVKVSTSIMNVVLENLVSFRPSFLANEFFAPVFSSSCVTLEVWGFSVMGSILCWEPVILLEIKAELINSWEATVVTVTGDETCEVTDISCDSDSFETVFRLVSVVSAAAFSEGVSKLERIFESSFSGSEFIWKVLPDEIFLFLEET